MLLYVLCFAIVIITYFWIWSHVVIWASSWTSFNKTKLLDFIDYSSNFLPFGFPWALQWFPESLLLPVWGTYFKHILLPPICRSISLLWSPPPDWHDLCGEEGQGGLKENVWNIVREILWFLQPQTVLFSFWRGPLSRRIHSCRQTPWGVLKHFYRDVSVISLCWHGLKRVPEIDIIDLACLYKWVER